MSTVKIYEIVFSVLCMFQNQDDFSNCPEAGKSLVLFSLFV